jgi:PI-3-kinase-related kinase SMG-1
VQAREFGQAKALVTEAARESIQWFDQHRRILDALSSGSLPEVQAIGQLPSAAEALSLTSAVVTTGVPLAIVPEPAQARCREVDREVAQLTAARHEAVLHAVQTLQAYSLALQHLLPVTYVTSSHVHAWAQVLQVGTFFIVLITIHSFM